MLTLVIAEAALELVPRELHRHPSVRAHAKRKGKQPGEIILDRTYHHAAMRQLKGFPEPDRRGRPDIVHFSLLEALGSPLNLSGQLRCYVQTWQEKMIMIDPKVRLPRNYDRFVGLVEQLFAVGAVPENGPALLTLRYEKLADLLRENKASPVILLSRAGRTETMEVIVKILSQEPNPTVLVGGFPHGRFTRETMSLAKETISIDRDPLEAWTVISRLVYEFERAIGLPEKRL